MPLPPFNPQDLVWRDSNEPLVLGPGYAQYPPVSIQVEPFTGSVVIEMFSLALNDWYIPTDAAHTITNRSYAQINRQNQPPVRIRATGNARFTFYGEIYSEN